jgi:hypothetical protein
VSPKKAQTRSKWNDSRKGDHLFVVLPSLLSCCTIVISTSTSALSHYYTNLYSPCVSVRCFVLPLAQGIVVKMHRIRGDKRTRPTVDTCVVPKLKDVTKPIRRRQTEEKAVRSRRAHKDLKPDRQAKHDPEARARARTPRVKTPHSKMPRVRTPRIATGAAADRRLEKASPGDRIPSPGIDAMAQTVSSLRPELLDSPIVPLVRRRLSGQVGSVDQSVELGGGDGISGSLHSFASAAGSRSFHTAGTDMTGSQRTHTMTDRTGSTNGSRSSHSSNPFSNSYVPGLSTLASDAATNSTNVTSIYTDQFSSIPTSLSNPSSYELTNNPSSHITSELSTLPDWDSMRPPTPPQL